MNILQDSLQEKGETMYTLIQQKSSTGTMYNEQYNEQYIIHKAAVCGFYCRT